MITVEAARGADEYDAATHAWELVDSNLIITDNYGAAVAAYAAGQWHYVISGDNENGSA